MPTPQPKTPWFIHAAELDARVTRGSWTAALFELAMGMKLECAELVQKKPTDLDRPACGQPALFRRCGYSGAGASTLQYECVTCRKKVSAYTPTFAGHCIFGGAWDLAFGHLDEWQDNVVSLIKSCIAAKTPPPSTVEQFRQMLTKAGLWCLKSRAPLNVDPNMEVEDVSEAQPDREGLTMDFVLGTSEECSNDRGAVMVAETGVVKSMSLEANVPAVQPVGEGFITDLVMGTSEGCSNDRGAVIVAATGVVKSMSPEVDVPVAQSVSEGFATDMVVGTSVIGGVKTAPLNESDMNVQINMLLNRINELETQLNDAKETIRLLQTKVVKCKVPELKTTYANVVRTRSEFVRALPKDDPRVLSHITKVKEAFKDVSEEEVEMIARTRLELAKGDYNQRNRDIASFYVYGLGRYSYQVMREKLRKVRINTKHVFSMFWRESALEVVCPATKRETLMSQFEDLGKVKCVLELNMQRYLKELYSRLPQGNVVPTVLSDLDKWRKTARGKVRTWIDQCQDKFVAYHEEYLKKTPGDWVSISRKWKAPHKAKQTAESAKGLKQESSSLVNNPDKVTTTMKANAIHVSTSVPGCRLGYMADLATRKNGKKLEMTFSN
jgi:hypothetical protein